MVIQHCSTSCRLVFRSHPFVLMDLDIPMRSRMQAGFTTNFILSIAETFLSNWQCSASFPCFMFNKYVICMRGYCYLEIRSWFVLFTYLKNLCIYFCLVLSSDIAKNVSLQYKILPVPMTCLICFSTANNFTATNYVVVNYLFYQKT